MVGVTSETQHSNFYVQHYRLVSFYKSSSKQWIQKEV